MNLFDILNSISFNKRNLLNNSDFEKEYNVFMINRYLSMNPETLNYAGIMDQLSQYIPKKLQFIFLKNIIPKEKRFFRYIKKETKIDIKKINLIKEYFQCNEERAIEYLNILDKKEISTIKNIYKGK